MTTMMKRSREEDMQVEAQAMANCALLILSRLNNNNISSSSTTDHHHNNDFECKTCNKRFPSFQALGGHRASHNKRPRSLGDFVIEAKKNKLHKCSICGMEFSLGQALGGHMRRHRDEINKTSMAAAEKMMIPVLKKSNSCKRIFCSDLNLTPNDNVDFKLWPTAPVPSPVLHIFIQFSIIHQDMTTMKRSRGEDMQVEAEAMANCTLMLLSRFNNNTSSTSSTNHHHGDFECKTCNKRFPSFQALGGHRASHNKRPRLLGDFVIEAKKNKMHQCSICGMEFSLGQALGGHMRRHRDEINKTSTMIPVLKKSNSCKRIFCSDLNLTPNDNVDFKLWHTAPVPSPVLHIFI
ncbi:zinc finger protein ZAT1-like [Lycium ferocissimum]|uniref:zinc finger protein ZAT1-like n=1 Tax=Lycium ferocissimum TaxID=112874 RepID=UPI00281616FE|nr:zinc finger protein ZAT1-like [Lycium ferocissimum]